MDEYQHRTKSVKQTKIIAFCKRHESTTKHFPKSLTIASYVLSNVSHRTLGRINFRRKVCPAGIPFLRVRDPKKGTAQVEYSEEDDDDDTLHTEKKFKYIEK